MAPSETATRSHENYEGPSIVRPRSTQAQRQALLLRGGSLCLLFIALCVIPDPKPFGAPQWAVDFTQSVAQVSETTARALATTTLRGLGLGLLGFMVAVFFSQPQRWAIAAALLTAPVLAIACQWFNYGYFPIRMQLQLSIISSILGGLAGLAVRRTRLAWLAFAAVAGLVIYWGTSTGISDELDLAARATGLHLLEIADQIPSGDAGFEMLLENAFRYAEDNSHRSDPSFPNRAAILALGVILGEQRVAEVAGRAVDPSRIAEFDAIRRRVTLRGRSDLVRHFWVSAALAVISDQDSSMSVGIAKEMLDATPGGSGFSFVDLTADRAGTMLAVTATHTPNSARAFQRRTQNGVSVEDFMPSIEGLPEGLTSDQVQNLYGGLGGARFMSIADIIRKRLDALPGLSPQPSAPGSAGAPSL